MAVCWKLLLRTTAAWTITGRDELKPVLAVDRAEPHNWSTTFATGTGSVAAFAAATGATGLATGCIGFNGEMERLIPRRGSKDERRPGARPPELLWPHANAGHVVVSRSTEDEESSPRDTVRCWEDGRMAAEAMG
jgi:hypothetical protein